MSTRRLIGKRVAEEDIKKLSNHFLEETVNGYREEMASALFESAKE